MIRKCKVLSINEENILFEYDKNTVQTSNQGLKKIEYLYIDNADGKYELSTEEEYNNRFNKDCKDNVKFEVKK